MGNTLATGGKIGTFLGISGTQCCTASTDPATTAWVNQARPDSRKAGEPMHKGLLPGSCQSRLDYLCSGSVCPAVPEWIPDHKSWSIRARRHWLVIFTLSTCTNTICTTEQRDPHRPAGTAAPRWQRCLSDAVSAAPFTAPCHYIGNCSGFRSKAPSWGWPASTLLQPAVEATHPFTGMLASSVWRSAISGGIRDSDRRG